MFKYAYIGSPAKPSHWPDGLRYVPVPESAYIVHTVSYWLCKCHRGAAETLYVKRQCCSASATCLLFPFTETKTVSGIPIRTWFEVTIYTVKAVSSIDILVPWWNRELFESLLQPLAAHDADYSDPCLCLLMCLYH